MSGARGMTLATVSPARRELAATCVHEAGHAVAGVALGAHMLHAVAVPGGHGRTHWFGPLAANADPGVHYAGPWAEARFLAGGQTPTQRQVWAVMDGHGRRDRDHLAALIASGALTDGRDVVPLLERLWRAVIAVARVIAERGEAIEADVLAALGVTDGGGPASLQLAALRVGARALPTAPRSP